MQLKLYVRCMEKHIPTIVVTLTEKLQKPKEICSELIILQYLGTWGQEIRLLSFTVIRSETHHFNVSTGNTAHIAFISS